MKGVSAAQKSIREIALTPAFLVLFVGLTVGPRDGYAEPDSEPTSKAAPIANDASNYVGDKVWFDRDIMVDVEDASGSPLTHKVCLPRRWLLRGGGAYTVNGNSAPENGTHFSLEKKPSDNIPLSDRLLSWKKRDKSGRSDPDQCNTNLTPKDYDPDADAKYLTPDVTIRVTAAQLASTPPNRLGLTYGALSVPFKYHLTGTHQFTGSASVGPYIGYRTDNEGFGFGFSLIGFLAASDISVPQPSSSASPTTTSTATLNLFGLSYGAGVIGTVKGHFQLGFVIGADRVSSNANYQYNGKPWAAMELGYSFLQ